MIVDLITIELVKLVIVAAGRDVVSRNALLGLTLAHNTMRRRRLDLLSCTDFLLDNKSDQTCSPQHGLYPDSSSRIVLEALS